MRSIALLLLFFFGLLLPQAHTQRDCGDDLECFLSAIDKNRSADYQHEDVSFFIPLSEPLIQQWNYEKAGRFSLKLVGQEVMQVFLEQVIRSQSYYNSTKWKNFLATAQEENLYLQLRLDCLCNDRELLQQQFRVWALGSYALRDLTRYGCILTLVQEETPTITIANDIDYRLRTLSVAKQTYRGGFVTYINRTEPTPIRLADGNERALPGYYTDFGQTPTTTYEGTLLGIDISSASDTPFRLEPTLSTLEYFQTEDGSSLLDYTTPSAAVYDFPQLYFGRELERSVRRFSANLQMEAPYTQRINIHANKRPAVGQYTVQAKGELVFATPQEHQIIYRDTIIAPRVIKRSSVPLEVGVDCDVEWTDGRYTKEVFVRADGLLTNYWSALKIYNLDGELLWETNALLKSPKLINVRAEGLIFEQTYSKVSYQRLPFAVNTGLDFMIGK